MDTSSTLPHTGRPQHQHDFWSRKINMVGRCSMCLGAISPGSRRNAVSTMEHIWPYLREDWKENPFADYVFIVGRVKEKEAMFLESKVPGMCALCRDSVKTLDKLHQELLDVKRRIETQVSGILKMMTASNFEHECQYLVGAMEREKLPLQCVENTVKFLNLLHGRSSEVLANFLLEKTNAPVFSSIFQQFSSIASSHLSQKRTSNKQIQEDQVEVDSDQEIKPTPSVTTLSEDGYLNEIVTTTTTETVIKAEVDSDYETHCPGTPPPSSVDIDQFLSTKSTEEDLQDEGHADNDRSSQASNEEETGKDSSSLRASSRALSKSTGRYPFRGRGWTQTKGKKRVHTSDEDSDYSLSESDVEESSGEDFEDDSTNQKQKSTRTLPSALKKVKIATNSQEKPTPKKLSTPQSTSLPRPRRQRSKSKPESEISASEDRLSKPHNEHVQTKDDVNEDYSISPIPKTKKVSRRSKRKTSGKLGRPRKHPIKEAKPPRRNIFCEICCVKLSDKSLLFEHLQSHVKDYACQCATCGTAYFSRKRMEAKHYKKAIRCRTAAGYPKPPEVKLKKCDTCDFETDSYLTLKAHLQEHEILTEKNFPCPLPDCTESFTVRQRVEFHLDKHMFQGTNSSASQKCSICSEAIEYNTEMDMRTHLQTAHGTNDSIQCNYCPYVFHNVESLLEHLTLMKHLSDGICCHICQDNLLYYKAEHVRTHYFTTHQIGMQYFCESCDYTTFSKPNLRGHQASKHLGKFRKTFTCEVCTNPPVVCRSKDNLVTHNIQVHGAKPYICKVCSETFDVKLNWSRHEKSHFGIAPRRQQCPHCEKTFNVLKRLQYHIERVHTLTPMERNHKCDQCEKSYLDSHGLKRHVQAIHLGIKYICEECGRQFSEPGPLKNHMRRHSGERPFKCSYCPNDFRYKDAHRRHEESHVKLGDKFQPGRTFDRKRKPL